MSAADGRDDVMWFWFYMFAMNNLIPVIMLVIGIWFSKHPPRKINAAAGYRTSRSMRNQETWDFAQNYCGVLWKKLGWIMLPVSVIVAGATYGMSEDGIGMVSLILIHIQLAVLLGSIYPVEKALKNTFDEEGNKKTEK